MLRRFPVGSHRGKLLFRFMNRIDHAIYAAPAAGVPAGNP